jgi:type IV secretion system protein VirD4
MTATPGLLREAAAPLLLLTTIAAVALLSVDVWLAAGSAALIGTGSWPDTAPDLVTLVTLVRDGAPAVLAPGSSGAAFVGVLIVAVLAQITAAAGIVIVLQRCGRPGNPRRSLLRPTDMGDLTGEAALRRARRLRPSLAEVGPSDRGIRLLSIDRREAWMSWEDVGLVVMGPRSNKTSALAVPTVLAAPGLVVATSNKADLWALTSGLRERAGPVWTFDPQRIAHVPQTWWWDRAALMVKGSRLAGSLIACPAGRRPPWCGSTEA